VGQKYLCQKAGQPGEESIEQQGRERMTPQLSEEVVDYAGQQIVQDDVDRRDLLITKTGWKWGYPKQIRTDNEVHA